MLSDISSITGYEDVSRKQKRELVLQYLMSLLPFDVFMNIRDRFVTWIPLEYNHDTSQLCRTDHYDVSHTRMTTLAFILAEYFPSWFQLQFRVRSIT